MRVGQRDPKTFWEIINKMNNWGKDTKDHTDNISPKKWKNYFEELLNDKIYEAPISAREEASTFEPILDGIIKKREVHDALALMKRWKSPGPDGIYGRKAPNLYGHVR